MKAEIMEIISHAISTENIKMIMIVIHPLFSYAAYYSLFQDNLILIIDNTDCFWVF